MQLHPDQKLAGILTPHFALRGKDDLGIGDIGALREMAQWCANHKFGVLQILPINETGDDNSPYNAISSAALEPTTIEATPAALKEITPEAYAEITSRYPLDEMRSSSVRYALVKALKRELLEAAFIVFEEKIVKGSARAQKFAAFCERNADWLKDYTLFRLLMEKEGTEQWDLWPADRQTAISSSAWLDTHSPNERAPLARRMQFFAYVQWIAYSQWKDLKKYCDKLGVALMGDIPIGVSYYSSDVFSRPEVFDLSWSCGAPPEHAFTGDPFTAKWGQNWGVPLYRWDVLERENYAWWRRRVQLVAGVFHLSRVDHILGFYRIYAFPWRPNLNAEFLNLDETAVRERTGGRLPGFIPHDDNSRENAEQNRHGGERILSALLEEVGAHRLIGEDLGVVPEYVRPSLAHLGIAGFKVPQWEKGWDGRLIPGASYQRLSIATYATHDHPPLRTVWEQWSETLNLAAEGNAEAAKKVDGIRYEMHELMKYAGIQGEPVPQPFTDAIREALLEALFAGNAWLAVPMITDVFGLTDRFNVPGAVAESNWSHRIHLAVAEWQKDPEMKQRMKRLRNILQRTGRAE